MPAFFNSDVLACFIFLHGLFFFGVMDTSSFSRHERIFISLVVFLSRTFLCLARTCGKRLSSFFV